MKTYGLTWDGLEFARECTAGGAEVDLVVWAGERHVRVAASVDREELLLGDDLVVLRAGDADDLTYRDDVSVRDRMRVGGHE